MRHARISFDIFKERDGLRARRRGSWLQEVLGKKIGIASASINRVDKDFTAFGVRVNPFSEDQ